MVFVSPLDIYSTEEFLLPVGGHVHECPRCDQLQPHLLFRVMKKEVGILIIRKQWEVGKVSLCEVCCTMSRHPKHGEIHTIERWNRNSRFADYAMRAGVESLQADHRLITPVSAEALLKSVTSTSAVSVDLNWKDYVVAGLVLLVAGALAMWVFVKHGNEENAISMLLGIPFGGLMLALGFLGVTQHRKRARNLHREAFEERLERLGVDASTVLSAMPQQVLRDESVYALLKPYM